MKILILVILIDIFIFTIGAIFVEDNTQDLSAKSYHVDRYGYYWEVDE